MAPSDVPDFMGQNGPVRLRYSRRSHQPARDVDIAARDGEGVDDIAVYQREAALPLEPRCGGDRLSDAREILCFVALVRAAELGEQLRMRFCTGRAVGFRDRRTVVCSR